MSVLVEIEKLFENHGGELYFGELVTQAEHALQAALEAETEGSTSALITSALLHDVGHLLQGLPEDIAQQGVDAHHEVIGSKWLGKYFGADVCEPMCLHVDAKRYLCTVEPEYLATLSDASVLSLKLQGGPFNPEQVAKFESNPHFKEAVRLRRWDDRAKIVGLETPDVAHFRPYIEASLKMNSPQ